MAEFSYTTRGCARGRARVPRRTQAAQQLRSGFSSAKTGKCAAVSRAPGASIEAFSNRIEGFPMSNVYKFVSPNADPVEQRAFFDAVKIKACMQLACKVAALRAALAEADGARGVLADSVLRGIVGEVALRERLTAEAAALSKLVCEARAGGAAYDEFVNAARMEFARETSRAARTQLDVGHFEIPELEEKIRGFERARVGHRERLLEAGLDSDQIDSADLLKPDADELAEWKRALEAKRDQVRRARAFLASGPLFDTAMLDGGSHAA